MPRIPIPKKTRLNLELAESVRKRLEALRVRTEADSMAEVIRRALDVYDAVVTARENGDKLVMRGPGEEEQTLVIV